MVTSSRENILSNHVRDDAGEEKMSTKQVDKAPVEKYLEDLHLRRIQNYHKKFLQILSSKAQRRR